MVVGVASEGGDLQLPAQMSLPEHGVEHAPQAAALDVVGVSQPFAATPSQSPKPDAQLATVQVPVEQSPAPFAIVHGLPHAPQFARSFVDGHVAFASGTSVRPASPPSGSVITPASVVVVVEASSGSPA